MVEFYNKVSLQCSQVLTKAYSTSFSSGISMLDTSVHDSIYAIYGFVRVADEIVDTFFDYDQTELFNRFKKDTFLAIEEKISLNPILQSFQKVVNEFHIDKELIDAFLYSMELDLSKKEYSQKEYEAYIYGSAEVVGLMCLKVFCRGNEAEYLALRKSACSLGAAFQKINFLRDVLSDYEDRGRVYFPGIDFTTFTEQQKKEIELDIKQDFDAGLVGINQLPSNAQKGVLLAYRYYIKLFDKIKALPVERIKTERIRVSGFEKFFIFIQTKFMN